MLHAVGLGWASRLQGDGRIAITYFGDGATSEGDFHEAMNFAAVFRTPTVFLCQNNQYAYSTPVSGQFAIQDIADRQRHRVERIERPRGEQHPQRTGGGHSDRQRRSRD